MKLSNCQIRFFAGKFDLSLAGRVRTKRFTDDKLREGDHILKLLGDFGPEDRIRHLEFPERRLSVNITLEGHTFHSGSVEHFVYFAEGQLRYGVLGRGQGGKVDINNIAGDVLFTPGVRTVVDRFGLRNTVPVVT